MLSFEDVFSSLHSIMACVGMSFNLLLIYLALFQTPKVIRAYATLIINFAFTDFCSCFFDFFVQQRIIPAGKTLAYISSGVCKYFGPNTCYVGYSLMLHALAHSLWSLLLSFSYRYYILLHPAPKRSTLLITIAIVYLPSLFQCISFLWAQDDPAEIVEILHKRFPDYELEGHVVTGTKDILCFSALFTILHMTMHVTPVYACILVLRKKIINRLSFSGVNVTKGTKDLHAQLLKALTYQALIPGFYVFSIASYTIGQFGIYHHPAIEYFTFSSFLFIPLLSPLASFIFVTPYRHFIKKSFYKAVKVDPTDISTTQNYAISSSHLDVIA